MKTSKFTISMKDGSTKEVEGVIVNGVWGIDKRAETIEKENANGEKRTLSSSSYYLTYIPKGILVTSARTRKALLELANSEYMINETDPYKMLENVVKFWDSKNWNG